MSPDLAIKLAYAKHSDNTPEFVIMQTANTIHEINESTGMKPFAEQDIVFARYIHFLESACTQRERDLVIIGEKLSRTWQYVHVNLQVFGEELNEYQLEEVKEVINCLDRLNQLHLLLDGLQDTWKQWALDYIEYNISEE